MKKMRLTRRLQLFLSPAKVVCDQSAELDGMDKILDEADGIEGLLAGILRDVNSGKEPNTGREGVTAEQILKLGILRRRHGLSYRDLAQATNDSLSMRRFLNLEPGKALSKSAIQGNLKKVGEETWEMANECLLQYAAAKGVEKGNVVRGDTTTVETNIHYPTDASLLNDVVRVLCRNMAAARQIVGQTVCFCDHRRRSKKKLYQINNAHGVDKRHEPYLELIRVGRETVHQAEALLPVLENFSSNDFFEMLKVDSIRHELKTHIPCGRKVVDQAYRRIVKHEQVPAEEKIVSIFEPETDIIVKGFRDVVFGHKIMLTTGASGLLLTLKVLAGNPKDSTLVPETLSKLESLYQQAPFGAAFDGCFASTANRDLAKGHGVSELTFSKNRSLSLSSLVSSPKMHTALLRFRAGVEGCISFLKRIFGFSRVLDRTKETFSAALQMGRLAYNLTLLTRMALAKEASS
jgi:IS5 family transposase